MLSCLLASRTVVSVNTVLKAGRTSNPRRGFTRVLTARLRLQPINMEVESVEWVGGE